LAALLQVVFANGCRGVVLPFQGVDAGFSRNAITFAPAFLK
jgi:hypothetical protein